MPIRTDPEASPTRIPEFSEVCLEEAEFSGTDLGQSRMKGDVRFLALHCSSPSEKSSNSGSISPGLRFLTIISTRIQVASARQEIPVSVRM